MSKSTLFYINYLGETSVPHEAMVADDKDLFKRWEEYSFFDHEDRFKVEARICKRIDIIPRSEILLILTFCLTERQLSVLPRINDFANYTCASIENVNVVNLDKDRLYFLDVVWDYLSVVCNLKPDFLINEYEAFNKILKEEGLEIYVENSFKIKPQTDGAKAELCVARHGKCRE